MHIALDRLAFVVNGEKKEKGTRLHFFIPTLDLQDMKPKMSFLNGYLLTETCT